MSESPQENSQTLEAVFELLEPGTVLLTPNARLAAQLGQRYRDWQAQRRVAWPGAQIYPFDAWLELLWQQLECSYPQPLPHRLTEIQSAHHWRSRIQPPANTLANIDTLATQLKSAWDRCQRWQIPITQTAFTHTPDTQFFYLQTQRVIDDSAHPSQWQQTLLNYLPQLQLPQRLIFAYFDHITPLHQRWLNALNQAQCEVERVSPKYCPKQVQRLAVSDDQQAMKQLMLWLTKQLEQGHNNIGVVLPDLRETKPVLVRELSRHFSGDTYNVSLGEPLAEQPLVNQILQLLMIEPQRLTPEQVHMLCFSQWLPGDKQARLTTYQRFQQHCEPMLSLRQLCRWLGTSHRLATGLHGFYQAMAPGLKQTARQWLDSLSSALTALGFPGEQPLDSHQFQLYQKWQQTQTSLIGLHPNERRITLKTFVSDLIWLNRQTLFQPQSPAKAQIHCLGLLESLGLHFDALWIMSADNQHFPPATQPSPFIPLQLQRQHALPRACNSNEYQIAKTQLDRLAHAASGEIIFCYASSNGDQYLTPSPLIEDYPLAKQMTATLPSICPSLVTHLANEDAITTLSDDHSPGGANVLQEQARCPFRAFSRHRLKLNPLPTTHIGLTPIQRGIILHHILENFWQEVKTQRQLLMLEQSQQLPDLIDTLISQILDQWVKRKPFTMQNNFYQREHQRLRTIINHYLPIEYHRSPFEVIAIEATQAITLAGLSFTLRVDRIDALDNGDWLVVDYKTGLTNISEWLQQPLTAPQLPMYALALPDEVKALALLQLQTRERRFKGISAQVIDIEGITAIDKKQGHDWESQQQQWLQQLDTLATAFKAGEHRPQPYRDTLCQQCDYLALCDKQALTTRSS